MRTRTVSLGAIALLLVLCLGAGAWGEAPQSIDAAYPGLLKGALASATFGSVPEGVLVQLGGDAITRDALDQLLAQASEDRRPNLEQNALFLVQEMATQRLLLRAVAETVDKRSNSIQGASEPQAIARHLQGLVADIEVTDAELEAFHAANQVMFNGASLGKVRDTLRAYLRKQKRQERVNEYVRGLGGAYGAVVAEDWGREHARRALDNPLDRARVSGRPTVVEFSAPYCPPCRKMEPILDALQEKYDGEVNIVTVQVPDYPALAARFGVTSTPTQIFFDTHGTEVHRNTGLLPEKAIEERLSATLVR